MILRFPNRDIHECVTVVANALEHAVSLASFNRDIKKTLYTTRDPRHYLSTTHEHANYVHSDSVNVPGQSRANSKRHKFFILIVY